MAPSINQWLKTEEIGNVLHFLCLIDTQLFKSLASLDEICFSSFSFTVSSGSGSSWLAFAALVFFFSLDKCTKIVMFYFYASLLLSYLRASIRPSSPFGWVARFTREHHANGDMSARLARLPFHTRADRWDIWSCDKNRLRWLVTLTLLVFTRKFKRNNFDEYMSGGGFVEYWGFSRGNLETSDMGTAGTVY